MHLNQYLFEAKYRIVPIHASDDATDDSEDVVLNPKDPQMIKPSHGYDEADGRMGGDTNTPVDGDPTEEDPSDENDDTDEKNVDTDGETGYNNDNIDDNAENQGLLRYVKGAHLVYKRPDSDGTFSELWMFPVKSPNIKDDIIAGTDIDIETGTGDDVDGNTPQKYASWVVGGVQMIKITGLPN